MLSAPDAQGTSGTTSKHYPNDHLLITPDTLHARLGDPALALIDTRPDPLT
jgi:hypothetical protein